MLETSELSKAQAIPVAVSDGEVIGQIRDRAGPLPQIALEYEPELKLLWLTIKPEPRPIFTLQLLESVGNVQRALRDLWGAREAYQRSPVRYLAFRGTGHLFTLGGDLEFYLECLAKGDRAGLEAYMRASVNGACLNASAIEGSVITISTIHAKAVGGGIDAPRSCNIMIAERNATFGYPEVKFNHFPITAVSVLSRHVDRATAMDMLMNGGEYSAEAFAQRGGLEAVVDDGTGEQWVRNYARETLPMHSARLALFVAFHTRQGDMRAELEHQGKLWVDAMMRLAPMEISRLQRVVQAQDRLLMRTYKKLQQAEAVPH